MRSAKTQKATLDPLKISGRCGRLMCCLRYEDETYETLRKRLPHRKKRVGTLEGPGIVVDSQILTQLVLVELESDQRRIAVPVEELRDPDAPLPKKEPAPDPLRGLSATETEERTDEKKRSRRRRGQRGKRTKTDQQDQYREQAQEEAGSGEAPASGAQSPEGEPSQPRKKRRRRRNRRGRGPKGPGDGSTAPGDG